MSLMLKLLSTTLLLSSFLYASTAGENVAEFLQDKFSDNPRFQSVEVKVADEIPLKELKGWDAYILDVSAYFKGKKSKPIKERMIWFSNGKIITKDLVDMDSGLNLKELIRPHFKDKYYTKANYLFGDLNARHKIVIFSDPLCPFCRGFVPGALRDLKKEPKKFVVYYYHLPLTRLHPASKTLVKAAVAAEQQGNKNVIEKLYNVKVNFRESDAKKILKAFNKAEGTNITLKDIQAPSVLKQVKADADMANLLMVQGTPTLFLDGKIDNTKKKYLKVK